VNGDDFKKLAASFTTLNESLISLRDEFSHYRTRVRWFLAVIVLVATALFGLIGVQMIVSHANSDVVHTIEDCTTPGGGCYERSLQESNRRTAPFIKLMCNATPPERREPPCPT
jgi:hypothetical protein